MMGPAEAFDSNRLSKPSCQAIDRFYGKSDVNLEVMPVTLNRRKGEKLTEQAAI